MRIGKLAESAGVNIETVRFYERKGLIKQPVKPASGYRDYPLETLNRILFIRRAQKLGFTLEEIDLLLSMEDAACDQVQALAEAKLTSVKNKLHDLKQMEKALKTLLQDCKSNSKHKKCPIIDALIKESDKKEL